jgi:VanZ family protein
LNNLLPHKQIPLKWLICLSVVFLFIILAVGLKPGGFRFVNQVSWIGDQPGIRFKKFGIAYTNPFNDLIKENLSSEDGFSLEIALKPASYHNRRFKFILALHNGKDSDQLLVGQWLSWLIVMNGDDYAHNKKTKRIAVNADSPSPIARFVTITTGKAGTLVYFDGKPVGANKALILKMPTEEKTRLTLGNSIYGKHPWRGDIYGLAIYDYPISSQEAKLHFNRWAKNMSFSFAGNAHPSLLYLFDEMEGTRVLDHAGRNRDLEIPLRMQVLKRESLAPPRYNFTFSIFFIKDTIINFVGFIPFGFILVATLLRYGAAIKKHAFLITVVFCFFVSFSLEILQAWIPSRSSSMLDLVLNTLGGFAGTMLYRFFRRKSRWFKVVKRSS